MGRNPSWWLCSGRSQNNICQGCDKRPNHAARQMPENRAARFAIEWQNHSSISGSSIPVISSPYILLLRSRIHPLSILTVLRSFSHSSFQMPARLEMDDLKSESLGSGEQHAVNRGGVVFAGDVEAGPRRGRIPRKDSMESMSIRAVSHRRSVDPSLALPPHFRTKYVW